MAAKLVAEEGTLKGLVLSLDDGQEWVIGRDPDVCQLLVEDPSASRKHLICRTTPKGILVENLSLTNPTEVNDEQVKEPRLLQNGDAVKIGDGLFRFYAEAAAHLYKEEPIANAQEVNHATTPEHNEEAPIDHAKEDVAAPPESSLPGQTNEPTTEEQESQLEDHIPHEPVNTERKEEPHMEALKSAETNSSQITPPTTQEEEEHRDTIFDEEPSDKNALAEINFGLLDTGRWLLKVIGGPNNGAEFSMQSASSYVLGTDPNACDIVFHDTSVSRQHARITVGQDESLTIEDLKSRNGTIVDGESLTGKRPLAPNMLVTLGTTSFVVYDREGEMQTIISPLIPSIVKVLQNEEAEKEEKTAPKSAQEAPTPSATELVTPPPPPPPTPESHHHITLGAFILIGILTGLLVIVGIGTTTLFKSEPITITQTVEPTQALDMALAQFPSVKYTFNKNTGQLLLVGHVLSSTDRNQLLYALKGLNFIKNLDDTGIVIDEYVWGEINQVISKNPEWKGITVMAPTPGHFIVSGYLKTRSQADRLSEYLSANFPYPDLLEKRVVVDEEVVSAINNILQTHNIRNVTVKLDNGEITLSGSVGVGAEGGINAVLPEIKAVRGVRSVRNQTLEVAQDQSMINLSDKYEVSGISNQAGKLSVVINGRILMKGDVLDGMTITSIQSNSVFLEKQGTKYRIDFNR